MNRIAIIGAGPSGLFAAECLLKKGFGVSVYDKMDSAGRKFLVAGSHGGLNITNDAPVEEFAAHYGQNSELFKRLLEFFSPADLKAWLAILDVKTFAGSGGKVFAENVDTREILDRWMTRLRSFPDFEFFPAHNLSGFASEKNLVFMTDAGEKVITRPTVIFALGGASWPTTGSDGKWTDFFSASGVALERFQAANCGFEADWSPVFKEKATNLPLKNIRVTAAGQTVRGELLVTPYGIEGNVVYTLGSAIRETINAEGSCTITLDLLCDWTREKIEKRFGDGPGTESLSNYYRKKLNLGGIAYSLLREVSSAEALTDARSLSHLVKNLPIRLVRPRPITEAISSAGGVRFGELDDSLMLKKFPGWFCAGEMLDWESPTGGFLLQGCFSTAYRASIGAAEWAQKTGLGTISKI